MSCNNVVHGKEHCGFYKLHLNANRLASGGVVDRMPEAPRGGWGLVGSSGPELRNE